MGKDDNTNAPDISNEELRELMEQNRVLIKQNRDLKKAIEEGGGASAEPLTLKKPKEHTVKLKFVDGKPVIGFANRGSEKSPVYVYEKPDPNNPKERIGFVDIILKGVKEPMPVVYTEFLAEADVEVCKILKIEKEDASEQQGMVAGVEVKDYRMEETGVQVPVLIEKQRYTYTVELPDGKSLDIDEEYVNMP